MNSQTIFELFKTNVKKDPTAAAIIEDNRTLSRQDLYQLAVSIAQRIPPDAKRVGIIMDHSAQMIGAILAVLSLGAAYVPIEPSFPEERIRYILNNSDVDAIIADQQVNFLDSDYPVIQPMDILNEGREVNSMARPDDLAYILYTSGSTGRPKGVAVTNQNVVSYIDAFTNEFNPQPDDVMLQYSVCTFDIFVEEVFSALLSGMALAIPTKIERDDLDKLLEFIREKKVTIISGFPFLLEEINEKNDLPPSLRLLISGGDVLREDYISNLKDKVDIYNTYGPSETTVCASYYKVEGPPLEDGSYPIGKPIKGSNINLLDENLNPVEPGETGEICISGRGVSQGYYGPDADNSAFITNPDGSRMFRSGDLGYTLTDGNLAFLERKDLQVMIEGKRVEPKEVENVINQYENLKNAAVISNRESNDRTALIAYLVWKNDSQSLADLQAYLKRFLPDYMIPKHFVILEELPTTINGKVDVKKLLKIQNDE